MNKTQRALALYTNKATDLAESLKKDIQKGSTISQKTVLALNAFIIAANNVKDLTDEIEKIDTSLN